MLEEAKSAVHCLSFSLKRSTQSQLQVKPKAVVEVGDKDGQRMRKGYYLDEETLIKDCKGGADIQMYSSMRAVSELTSIIFRDNININ